MSEAIAIPLPTDPMRDAVHQVEHEHRRVVLTRDGKPVAAVVPIEDLRALEELDEAEDAHWSRVAAAAVTKWEAEGRPAGVSHEELARQLGIDLTGEP